MKATSNNQNTHLRQGVDKVVNVGRLCSLDDLLRRHLPEVGPVADVVCHAAIEEHRLLGDDADLPPEPGNVEVSDVGVVQSEGARDGVVEVLQEGDDCALAAAAGPHQCQRFPALDADVQALQDRHVRTGWVVKGDGGGGHFSGHLLLEDERRQQQFARLKTQKQTNKQTNKQNDLAIANNVLPIVWAWQLTSLMPSVE